MRRYIIYVILVFRAAMPFAQVQAAEPGGPTSASTALHEVTDDKKKLKCGSKPKRSLGLAKIKTQASPSLS